MKKVLIIILVIIVILLAWWLWQKNRTEAEFSGFLNDASGKAISGAIVRVGDESTTTDEEGKFAIKGSRVKPDRWVLDIRKPGFEPVSKVYNQGSEDIRVATVKATTQMFDPGSSITARSASTNCIGSLNSDVDWGAYPTARFPRVIDADGNRVSGPLPSTARRALDFLSGTQPCSSGFQVSIPANALVNPSGQPATQQVEVSVSTVDLYSPDGMPGDYTVISDDGPAYMESLGAGTIEVRDGDEVFQLKKGTRAAVEIPVDRAQIEAGSKIPSTIPLLQYEPGTGEWRRIGEAGLDEKRMVYTGEVEHFSEFNADVVKTDPACVCFDAGGISGDFDLVITAPTSSGGFRQVTKHVTPNPNQSNPNLHAVYNLPPNEWVVLRAIKSGTPIGTWILETGGPWGGTGAPSEATGYTECGAALGLSETVGTGATYSGANRRFGPLPEHLAYLVDTSGASEDVYPVGSALLYLYSLFDPGSNLVKLGGDLCQNYGLSSSPGSSWDVDVRINGLGVLDANLGAPYGLPGNAGGAQANTGILRVGCRNNPNQAVFVEETQTDTSGNPTGGSDVGINHMLAGAPVANRVVARIDYTAEVTKGPWTWAVAPFIITAPDIEFYMPGDPAIPAPTLTLFLEGFGTPADLTTGTTDQRPFLQNVTFTKGTQQVYDEQTPTNPVRFLYDSATTFTVISQSMANLLGVSPTNPNPAAGCSSNNQANFVQLDSITIVGMDNNDQLAAYQVDNPEVCVDVGDNVIITHYEDPADPAAPPKKVDAVIGSNLFDQAKILWNGPERTLGILP